MNLEYGETLNDIKQLLDDLAMPWEDPWSFSGFGTPFQEKISQFSDFSEAMRAVDQALQVWAAKSNPAVFLNHLADILTYSQRSKPKTEIERWDHAVHSVVGALNDTHPEAIAQFQQQVGNQSVLHNYLHDEL